MERTRRKGKRREGNTRGGGLRKNEGKKEGVDRKEREGTRREEETGRGRWVVRVKKNEERR